MVFGCLTEIVRCNQQDGVFENWFIFFGPSATRDVTVARAGQCLRGIAVMDTCIWVGSMVTNICWEFSSRGLQAHIRLCCHRLVIEPTKLEGSTDVLEFTLLIVYSTPRVRMWCSWSRSGMEAQIHQQRYRQVKVVSMVAIKWKREPSLNCIHSLSWSSLTAAIVIRSPGSGPDSVPLADREHIEKQGHIHIDVTTLFMGRLRCNLHIE